MKSVQPQTLDGSFKDFPLKDLFMLVAQQRRTGILHLSTTDDRAIDVMFREGLIYKAKKYRPKARELFGNLLVESGIITEQQRAKAVEEQRRTLKQLGEILVESGALTREALRDFVALQTQEVLYLPFEWPEGSWKFIEMEVGLDFENLPPLDCTAIIEEGLRRQSIWPWLRRKFSSEVMTFRRVKGLPPPGSPELLKAQKKGLILGARERRVYALAEPTLPITTIVATSRLGEFETLLALSNLCDLGYLKFGAQGREDTRVGSDGRSKKRNVRSIASVAFFCMILLCLLGFIGQQVIERRAYRELRPSETTLRGILANAQKSRISSAIEIYRLIHGELPKNLDDLVSEGLLRPGDERYPFETRYGYSLQGEESYLLLQPLH